MFNGPHTQESRIKIGQASTRFHTGRKLSDAHRRKLSLSHMGVQAGENHPLFGKPRSEETKQKLREANLGKKYSQETKQKLSELRKGSNHWNWQGGKTPIALQIRRSLEYKLWRDAVFKRDNWTCVICKVRGKKKKRIVLNADHIKSFALYPELRFAIDNGRTLCLDCHKKTDSYLNRWMGKNNKHEKDM